MDVGALKANDHRLVKAIEVDSNEPYSSIRSGKLHPSDEDEDDWD